ncbi:hypothetical protein CLD22_00100 [Rubrivivax gelatinosus]|nr:hypothetical protein [Rubrivivax gelatinosus]
MDRLPWSVARRIQQLAPPPQGYAYRFGAEPLVMLIPEDHFEEAARWEPLFQALARRRVYFLALVRSAIERDPAYEGLILPVLARHRRRFPEHRFVFLANNAAQTALFERLDIESVFVNQNCLANEALYRPLPDETKAFDAIHNATMAPYKRHELAAGVGSLAIVTYLQSRHHDYFGETARRLAHARWLNFGGRALRPDAFALMTPQEVNRQLARSRVGLCLSEVEGAMFASIEYLLAGLPVVSTPSHGGRDVFFDERFVEVVEPSAAAVAAAVERLLARSIEAQAVRDATLERIAEHRARLASLLTDIGRREGLAVDGAAMLARQLPDDVYKLRPLHRLIGAVA